MSFNRISTHISLLVFFMSSLLLLLCLIFKWPRLSPIACLSRLYRDSLMPVSI